MKIDTTQIAERLPDQRWFGWKDRAITAVEVVDAGVLQAGPPPLVLTILKLSVEGLDRDLLYQMPLIVEADGSSRDAFEDLDRLRVFGHCLAHGASLHGDHGTFRFTGPGLDPLAPLGTVSARTMGAEQTNTSLVLDEAMIVKVFRRVDYGHNPDLELTRALTNEGFEHIPPHLGELVYDGTIGDEEVSIDLCLAQQYFTDSVEGWSETVKRLQQLYDQVDDVDLREDMRYLTEERASDILTAVQELGEVTASLHVALSREGSGSLPVMAGSREEDDPELLPEPITPYDLRAWATATKDSFTALLEDGFDELGPLQDELFARIEQLTSVAEPGLRTRVHSDYHLGQVLLTARGWMILDFEGEPARTIEERRAKQSPLRDVAGMLRSFNYAAVSCLFDRAEPDSEEWKRLEPWAEMWETLARERFLHGYRSRAHEGNFLPANPDDLLVMLDVFEIDKAIYEIGYERGHRPDWARIPLRGITKTLERNRS